MTVLNKHHGNIPADAIYIGRGSKWGNPFVIGKDGTRDEVCAKYDQMIMTQIKNDELLAEDLAPLHGKDLVCFCAPARCHGESLEKYAGAAHKHLQIYPSRIVTSQG